MGGHERLWVGGIVTVIPLSGVLVVHGSGLPLLVTYQGEKWCPTVVSCYRPLVSSHSVSQSPISQDTILSMFSNCPSPALVMADLMMGQSRDI